MGREENESSTRDAKRRNAHLELAPRAQKLAIHGGSVRHLYRAAFAAAEKVFARAWGKWVFNLFN